MRNLSLQNVSKNFGGVVAVDRLSLDFEEGQVSALIGPNGAGKTTVFNLIGGLERPTGGEIFYHGKRISDLPPWRIAAAGIGRLFQDTRVFDQLTVLENVLTAFQHQRGENPIRSVLTRNVVSREERVFTHRANKLLATVGLPYRHQLAANLSYGEQKLLSLARLLAAGMDVLLLDEPTAGLSPGTTLRLLALLRGLAQQGKTIVIIEHNMSVISEFVDHVFVISKGQLISSGVAEVVLESEPVRTAYLSV